MCKCGVQGLSQSTCSRQPDLLRFLILFRRFIFFHHLHFPEFRDRNFGRILPRLKRRFFQKFLSDLPPSEPAFPVFFQRLLLRLTFPGLASRLSMSPRFFWPKGWRWQPSAEILCDYKRKSEESALSIYFKS